MRTAQLKVTQLFEATSIRVAIDSETEDKQYHTAGYFPPLTVFISESHGLTWSRRTGGEAVLGGQELCLDFSSAALGKLPDLSPHLSFCKTPSAA